MILTWDLGRPDDPRKLLGLLMTPDVAQYLVRYIRGPISHDEALVEIMDLPPEDYGPILKELLGG